MWDQDSLQTLVRDKTLIGIEEIEDYDAFTARLFSSPIQVYVEHLRTLSDKEQTTLLHAYLDAFWQVYPDAQAASTQATADVLHEALRAISSAIHHQQNNSDLIKKLSGENRNPVHGESLSKLIVSNKNLTPHKNDKQLSQLLLKEHHEYCEKAKNRKNEAQRKAAQLALQQKQDKEQRKKAQKQQEEKANENTRKQLLLLQQEYKDNSTPKSLSESLNDIIQPKDVEDLSKRAEVHARMSELLKLHLDGNSNQSFEDFLKDNKNKTQVKQLLDDTHLVLANAFYTINNDDSAVAQKKIDKWGSYHIALVSLKYQLFHHEYPNPMIVILVDAVRAELPDDLTTLLTNCLKSHINAKLPYQQSSMQVLMMTSMVVWFLTECAETNTLIQMSQDKKEHFNSHKVALLDLVDKVKTNFLISLQESAANQIPVVLVEDKINTVLFYLQGLFSETEKPWANIYRSEKLKSLFLRTTLKKCAIDGWTAEKKAELKEKILRMFKAEALFCVNGLLAQELAAMISPTPSVAKPILNKKNAPVIDNELAKLLSTKTQEYLARVDNRETLYLQLKNVITRSVAFENNKPNKEALTLAIYHAMKAIQAQSNLSDSHQKYQYMALVDFEYQVLNELNPLITTLVSSTVPLSALLNHAEDKKHLFEQLLNAAKNFAPFKITDSNDFELLMLHTSCFVNQHMALYQTKKINPLPGTALKKILDDHISIVLLLDQFQKEQAVPLKNKTVTFGVMT